MIGGERAILGWALIVTACSTPHPRPIAYGSEPCARCHMTIADPRFSGELVTNKRRVYVFDDPGCLAAFYLRGPVPAEAVHSLWVNDFLHPNRFLDATRAVYLRSDSLHSPMGSGLAALDPGPAADSLRAQVGGTLLAWKEVLDSARLSTQS